MRSISIFVLFFICFNLTAQELLVSGRDTLICFSPAQSKFLLKEIAELDQCRLNDSINKKIIEKQDSIIISINQKVLNKDGELIATNDILNVCKIELENTRSELSTTKKSLTKQKRRTRLSISLGSIITAVLATLLIVK